MKISICKIFFIFCAALPFFALTGCNKSGQYPASVTGRYKAMLESTEYTHLFDIAESIIEGSDKKQLTVAIGTIVPGQKPDWLFMPPALITVDKDSYTFSAPVDPRGDAFFSLRMEKGSLNGTYTIGTDSYGVTLLKLHAGENMDNPEQPEYTDREGDDRDEFAVEGWNYNLGKQYAGDFQDEQLATAIALFSSASALEGEVSLTFSNDSKSLTFWCSDPGADFVQALFDPAEGANSEAVQKPFVIRYKTGEREDAAGNTVPCKIPVEIFTYQKDRYQDFGILNAFKLYLLLDQLAAMFRAQDYDKLADTGLFPLAVTTPDGGSITIADKPGLLQLSKELFNDKVRNAVVNQSYQNIFINSQGIMLGNGEIWLAVLEDDDFGLMAINPF